MSGLKAGLKRPEIEIPRVKLGSASAALTDQRVTSYRFDHFEIRPTERRLLVDGHPASLGARAFDLLLALVERRDRTVTKNELLDLVWPGLVVEENNLQVQISTLRKVLGQHAIATIPGQGYRFTLRREDGPASSLPPIAAANSAQSNPVIEAPVTAAKPDANGPSQNIAPPVEVFRLDPGSGVPRTQARKGWQRLLRFREWRWAGAGVVAIGLAAIAFWTLPQFWKTAPAPAPPAMSVAIVPFTAPHGDADASRFADALTRDLVTRIGRVEGRLGRVRVVSGPSVTTSGNGATGAREMGRSLNVRYVVEGDVLRGGDGYTANLRLVDTTTGGQVWSEQDGLQDSDLTTESSTNLYNLSARLRTALVSSEVRRVEALPVSALSARELVLRANAMTTKNPSLAELIQARKLVDEALRLEPDLEPALIAGAIITESQNDVDPNPDHARIVRDMDEFTGRAIRLEPSDPGAWHMRTIALIYLGRWDAALQASDMRIKIAPGDSNSYAARARVMNLMGRPDEALKLVERALAMNPTDLAFPLWIGCEAHLLAGQAPQAIAKCEKSTGLWTEWMDPCAPRSRLCEQRRNGQGGGRKGRSTSDGARVHDLPTARQALFGSPGVREACGKILVCGAAQGGDPGELTASRLNA